jgi:hypothetical protein
MRVTVCLCLLAWVICGCSGEAPKPGATPKRDERLPAEVEHGPEEALKQSKKSRPR